MSDEQEFYRHHRGGRGAVLLVIAFPGQPGHEQHGIFGSIETAQSWINSLGAHWTSVVSPYIVDDPDWGNERPDDQ